MPLIVVPFGLQFTSSSRLYCCRLQGVSVHFAGRPFTAACAHHVTEAAAVSSNSSPARHARDAVPLAIWSNLNQATAVVFVASSPHPPTKQNNHRYSSCRPRSTLSPAIPAYFSSPRCHRQRPSSPPAAVRLPRPAAEQRAGVERRPTGGLATDRFPALPRGRRPVSRRDQGVAPSRGAAMSSSDIRACLHGLSFRGV